jgi:YVTN family beta-propeller protein
MTNNHKMNAIALATSAADRAQTIRRMTLVSLAAAAGIAAAFSAAPLVRAEPAASGFVYTADEHGGSISRIDLGSGTVEFFPLPVMPHNVQFVPGTGRLLAVGVPPSADDHGRHGSSGQGAAHDDQEVGGKLVVFDTGSAASAPTASITVGGHPAHVVADGEGKLAFVSNSDDDSISVIDLATGRTVKMIYTGDYPHGLRMSPDRKSIYVANIKDGTVSVLDAENLAETARIEVGAAPVQVGFTPDGRRVYVSLRDENQVAVIDTATREVIHRINVGRAPIQVHATPDGRFVYVANQGTGDEPDDTVSVVETATNAVVKTIRTGAGAHGVTVSNDGAFVFVTNILDGTVSEISVESQSVVRTFRVGKGPNGITFQAPKSVSTNAG